MNILSLFDYTGLMIMPWSFEQEHNIVLVDIKQEKDHWSGAEVKNWDLDREGIEEDLIKLAPDIIFSFPPCTDLAIAGAAYWHKKFDKDPYFQVKAAYRCRLAERIGQALNVPWMVENPKGMLNKFWRQPDFIFHPFEFGGYLSEDDKHPFWPEAMPARDAYTKRTSIWYGNGFIEPKKKPVKIEVNNYVMEHRTDSELEMRSATPRGFAYAVWKANRPGARD